jgi:hypothetical protein
MIISRERTTEKKKKGKIKNTCSPCIPWTFLLLGHPITELATNPSRIPNSSVSGPDVEPIPGFHISQTKGR